MLKYSTNVLTSDALLMESIVEMYNQESNMAIKLYGYIEQTVVALYSMYADSPMNILSPTVCLVWLLLEVFCAMFIIYVRVFTVFATVNFDALWRCQNRVSIFQHKCFYALFTKLRNRKPRSYDLFHTRKIMCVFLKNKNYSESYRASKTIYIYISDIIRIHCWNYIFWSKYLGVRKYCFCSFKKREILAIEVLFGVILGSNILQVTNNDRTPKIRGM